MHDISKKLSEYSLPSGKGYGYITEAVELYRPDCTLKSVYSVIAMRHGTTPAAVARSVSMCVASSGCDAEISPKELIARVKERIMFDGDE